MKPLVGVIMGSASDWATMTHTTETLESLGIAFEARVVSAHRTPDLLFEYASGAAGRGLEVLIAGAGGAAHLPGMAAAKTRLPVLGVPVKSRALSGIDSLLSIVQMPRGVPVATLAIGKSGAVNAALLAASILANKYPAIALSLDGLDLAHAHGHGQAFLIAHAGFCFVRAKSLRELDGLRSDRFERSLDALLVHARPLPRRVRTRF